MVRSPGSWVVFDSELPLSPLPDLLERWTRPSFCKPTVGERGHKVHIFAPPPAVAAAKPSPGQSPRPRRNIKAFGGEIAFYLPASISLKPLNEPLVGSRLVNHQLLQPSDTIQARQLWKRAYMPLADLDLGKPPQSVENAPTMSPISPTSTADALTGPETSVASEKGQSDGNGHFTDRLVPVFILASVVAILG